MALHFHPPYTPTYEGAARYLGSKQSKRISGNTSLIRISPNCIVLRLHATDIVQYRDNGMILIDTGGYDTNTTKRYINGAAPVSVHTKDFQLYANGEKWDGGPLVVKQAD